MATLEQIKLKRMSSSNRLRLSRLKLLESFDKWEKGVLRGREQDDEVIMSWYQDVLDLKESAFNDDNIPDKIKYYLNGISE